MMALWFSWFSYQHFLAFCEFLLIVLYQMLSDPSVPASTAETSTSANVDSRVRALKQPVTSHRALVPKMQSHGKLGVPRCQSRPLMALEVLWDTLIMCGVFSKRTLLWAPCTDCSSAY